MLSTVEKVLFLKSIDLFSQIPGEDLAAIALISSEESRDQADEIFAEGESGDALYLVIDGKVRVHKSDRVIAELGERECFGEMALVELQPRSAACVVRKKTVTYSLTNPELWNVYKSDNFAYVIILQNICRMLSRRLRKADSRIVEFLEASENGKASGARKKATSARNSAKKKK